ncbi:hypothetical protein ONS95_002095 [Cadophora gregata]|uniref:uncharacterized protein n=1 Tax=Cadophora gregata TaxID=51156 RepID=UPI0026DAF4E6|nr:uncharacterized protein ONS95_002095 [Cadophora gregata]KAK0111760.1 hypothetical protein ONS95_002095 [Cadophora gregata]KAK0111769.1 hypothetical protein ONS96_001038 [Cadophora gregata f. sp. sojae]
MEDVPITGLEELERHLQHVVDTPETPLDAKLFDEVELQLTDYNIPPLIPRLLPNLSQILLTYEQDPAILASLAIKLLRPIQFTQALTLASEDALIQALRSPAPSANILAITVIEKAARSPSDTAILSIMKALVENFLQTWLSTPDVGVAEKATKVLGDLLEVDCDRRSSAGIDTKMNGLQLASGMPPGQGLLWRRIFQDREIYQLLFSLCSSSTAGTSDGQLNERQKSLAQARLLRVLPRLATLDFQTITRSQFPDVEKSYEIGQPGVLYFATVDMVNKEEDMLMHITLMDFFAEFLEMMSTTELTKSTMDYLAALVKKVASSDPTMYKHLETIAMSPETAETSPELVDLLLKLNEYP